MQAAKLSGQILNDRVPGGRSCVIVPCIIDSWNKVSRRKAGSKLSHWVVIVSSRRTAFLEDIAVDLTYGDLCICRVPNLATAPFVTRNA